ncbi:sphingosine-1-phosphate phosphatase 1 [Agrilus planipennis]|uniref:Sphingosine-1-phosphate phosphatase 1 n=1 Tax=Agrilus planipennis TaxID=224129 RepID=A0A7F5R223_AGRPL|nr:sphingosine-1-phosphate phosphatase 1 [Agrilus planipennis]XP_025828983.1 sphingosine-1-phosphate phosphatase 1 [Agrilus planipennis]
MDLFNFLKRPSLVADIQRFFGVQAIKEVDLCERKNISNQTNQKYTIKNYFWYYLFCFGTELGDEMFYLSFIPFWFWNIDGAVGRRVVLVWTIVMYIGQGIKDIIKWERPGPPVIKLQKKWALEYGMPSTHAMVGVSIPFSVILYTMNRYQYNVQAGFVIAIVWCSIVSISRLYLGMHTVLDVLAGLALSIMLMFPLVPLIDKLDSYFLTNPTSPFLLIVISLLMIVYYPNSGKWTPTRGDTTMIVSVCVGLLIGAWLNYQTGNMTNSDLIPPYAIFWPSYTMLGSLILRTTLGFVLLLFIRSIAKSVSYKFLCTLLGQNATEIKNSKDSLDNKHKTFVDLGCKYLTCAVIGFSLIYLLPNLFKFLKIERPTFCTEL